MNGPAPDQTVIGIEDGKLKVLLPMPSMAELQAFLHPAHPSHRACLEVKLHMTREIIEALIAYRWLNDLRALGAENPVQRETTESPIQ